MFGLDRLKRNVYLSNKSYKTTTNKKPESETMNFERETNPTTINGLYRTF